MKDIKILFVGVLAALATLATGVGRAEAQQKMLVLVDASGSMLKSRPSDNHTRFDAAKALSESKVTAAKKALGQDEVLEVAVYTFGATSVTPWTANTFVDPDTAITAIQNLTPPVNDAIRTPLAMGLCDSIDRLMDEPAEQRIILLSSDGEENNSMGHPCWGTGNSDPTPPFDDPTSWQGQVWLKLTTLPGGFPPIMDINLFQYDQITSFTSFRAQRSGEGGEGDAPPAARMTALAADAPSPLEVFFGEVARVSGGSLAVIKDSSPLPVYADLNGDRCVDHSDAFEVLRRFGQRTPAVEGKYDLDFNRSIGYGDYAAVVSHITGTCGERDDLVATKPLRCTTGEVLLDGRSIETDGMAIDVRGSCHVTIRNSRIVSGGVAIRIRGSAIVTIDDSIVAGERVVLGLKGSAVLSAAGTYFKGKKEVDGSLKYEDRGGNTWE